MKELEKNAISKKSQTSLSISKTSSKPRSVDELERTTKVEAIIQLITTELRQNELTPIELAKTAAAWEMHFDNADIPTDKLLGLYYDAFGAWDGKGRFSHANMIHFWKENCKQTETVPAFTCSICGGTGFTQHYDIMSRKEITRACLCSPEKGDTI